MKSLKLILLLIPSCIPGQDYHSTFKHPEYYLPHNSVLITYEFFVRDSSYQEQLLFAKEGRFFIQTDDLNQKTYYKLEQSSLYVTNEMGGDMDICLKYPLRSGRKWIESNTIPVEILGLNETVHVKGQVFTDCLKILKTIPLDIIEKDTDEPMQILEVYAPGRWLVAEMTYPDMAVKRVQLGSTLYTGQFKTYKSMEDKLRSLGKKAYPDSVSLTDEPAPE